ncbi:MAG: molybdopterin cofactor-binding domain-containing protein, partial [Bacteroidales bacterium]
MISWILNGQPLKFSGDPEMSLLGFLRNEKHITSAKDACSGQGACGACTVEIDGKPKLACRVKMKEIGQSEVITTEGLPEKIRQLIGETFASKGAVQCGFCTPGFIMRMHHLIENKPFASREEIKKAVSPNLCRCTGYVKIVDAIESALQQIREEKRIIPAEITAEIGQSFPKYEAVATALGERKFVDDMHFEGMLHGALLFSPHPKALIKSIDVSEAEKLAGVKAIFTSKNIPGDKFTGLIFSDWPLMIGPGETTRYIGDVLALVIAETEETARKSLSFIKIDLEELSPVTDMHQALAEDAVQVHPDRPNLLERCKIQSGNISEAFDNAVFISSGIFETQRIEHAFLETETAIALPDGDGIKIFSQGQGVYVDQKLIAKILALPIEKVRVVQVSNGGGFGGKEDMTVQGHAALAAWLLKKPVK